MNEFLQSRFGKFAIAAFLVLTLINSFFNGSSYFDRKELHAAQERLIMNREMLNTRARNQTTVIKAVWHLLPPEERTRIVDEWEKAEYHLVTPAPAK